MSLNQSYYLSLRFFSVQFSSVQLFAFINFNFTNYNNHAFGRQSMKLFCYFAVDNGEDVHMELDC